MINANLRKDLNAALRQIAEKLDLDDTRHQNARQKYAAVGKWLEDDNSPLGKISSTIYPQGSFSLGTVVKPINAEEYDIDLVYEMASFQGSPEELKRLIGDRLKSNEVYKTRLEEKNRCWRINYAGDFHLDILPARLDASNHVNGTAIEVPDKDLHNWIPSDPKGYKSWFMNCMAEQYNINLQLLAQAEQKSIDDVPEYKVRTTLQQAIQLLKRSRDIMFEKDIDDKPISIIITTLAGKAYSNQADLFETISSLVIDIPKYIEDRNGEAWVTNPANPDENFAEKWEEHPHRKRNFYDWLDNLRKKLNDLRECSTISYTENILFDLFGESLASPILQDIYEQKKASSVYVPPAVKIDRPNKPWQRNE